ncbi:MAG TPA: hypothetical protein DF383_09600 [Deltaproteobacteria bacterium]|nr:hypothetical protein [Deltaproteobacteria bacterium]
MRRFGSLQGKSCAVFPQKHARTNEEPKVSVAIVSPTFFCKKFPGVSHPCPSLGSPTVWINFSEIGNMGSPTFPILPDKIQSMYILNQAVINDKIFEAIQPTGIQTHQYVTDTVGAAIFSLKQRTKLQQSNQNLFSFQCLEAWHRQPHFFERQGAYIVVGTCNDFNVMGFFARKLGMPRERIEQGCQMIQVPLPLSNLIANFIKTSNQGVRILSPRGLPSFM